MKVLLLLACVAFYSTYAFVCIENIALNTSYPYQTDFDTSATYCGSIIQYSVSDTTALQASTYHAQALANYQVMVEKWKARASTSDNPTNDCMGVARTFFCTQAFPGCNDDEDGLPLCDFLCTLYKRRCPDETYFHDLYCSNSRGKDCTFAPKYTPNIVLLVILSLLSIFIL